MTREMDRVDLRFIEEVVRFHVTPEGGLEIVGQHETIELDAGELQQLTAWLHRGPVLPPPFDPPRGE